MGWFSRLFRGGKKEQAMEMEEPAPGARTAKDPVCGMEVDEKTAPATSEYKGETYYFCAPGCKNAFDENPAKYTGDEGHEMAGHGGHRM